VTAGPWLAETLAACRSPETLASAHPGEALKTTSRSYQPSGCAGLAFCRGSASAPVSPTTWGSARRSRFSRCLLTVSEGGGERRPSLIVAPASLIANWAAEAERFSPSLNVFVAHPAFTPAELLKSTSAEDLVGIDLVVTSYAALLRLDWLGKTRWRLVDKAHPPSDKRNDLVVDSSRGRSYHVCQNQRVLRRMRDSISLHRGAFSRKARSSR
jgi:non-specific serine/threonine protein kinase